MPLTLNGTTGISFPDGSSGTPALRGTDSDTGVFFPAADTIALVEGGTEVLRVTSAGTVGIGTTNPAEKLQVQGRVVGTSGLRAGTTAAIASSGELLSVLGQASIRLDSSTSATTYLINADTTASTIQPYLFCSDTAGNRAGIGIEYSTTVTSFYGQGGISLQTGTSGFGYANERVRITSTGNVGIGTTNPADKLHVQGGVRTTQLSISTATFNYIGGSGTDLLVNGDDNIAFRTDNEVERVRITASGNVGIGTTNPGAKLDVSGTIKINGNSDMPASGGTSLYIGGYYGSPISGKLIIGDGTGWRFDIGRRSSSTDTALFTFSDAGNLGIGTTNPITKLDVRNGIITAGSVDAPNGAEILRGYYSAGALAVIGSEYSSGGIVIGSSVKPSTSASNAFFSSTSINVSRGAYTIAGNIHKWYIGSTQTVAENSLVSTSEVMRINSTGNVGIGTTNPAYPFDVRGSSWINGASIQGATVTFGSSPITKTITISTANSDAMMIIASAYTSGGANSAVKQFIVGGYIPGSTQYAAATVSSATTGSSISISDITKANSSFSFTMTLSASLNSQGEVAIISRFPATITVT